MTRELFPSGPWIGFYNYRPGGERHYMSLTLEFAGGIVTGSGNDDIGFFTIVGTYDIQELECNFIKTYPGSHEVSYRGFREGRGIWGVWEIPPGARGGFYIWPVNKMGEEIEEEKKQAIIPLPSNSRLLPYPKFYNLPLAFNCRTK